jgi:hypothetical protein
MFKFNKPNVTEVTITVALLKKFNSKIPSNKKREIGHVIKKIEYYDKKAYGKVVVYIHVFLTSAFPWVKSPPYRLDKRVGGSQDRS